MLVPPQTRCCQSRHSTDLHCQNFGREEERASDLAGHLRASRVRVRVWVRCYFEGFAKGRAAAKTLTARNPGCDGGGGPAGRVQSDTGRARGRPTHMDLQIPEQARKTREIRSQSRSKRAAGRTAAKAAQRPAACNLCSPQTATTNARRQRSLPAITEVLRRMPRTPRLLWPVQERFFARRAW